MNDNFQMNFYDDLKIFLLILSRFSRNVWRSFSTLSFENYPRNNFLLLVVLNFHQLPFKGKCAKKKYPKVLRSQCKQCEQHAALKEIIAFKSLKCSKFI